MREHNRIFSFCQTFSCTFFPIQWAKLNFAHLIWIFDKFQRQQQRKKNGITFLYPPLLCRMPVRPHTHTRTSMILIWIWRFRIFMHAPAHAHTCANTSIVFISCISNTIFRFYFSFFYQLLTFFHLLFWEFFFLCLVFLQKKIEHVVPGGWFDWWVAKKESSTMANLSFKMNKKWVVF